MSEFYVFVLEEFYTNLHILFLCYGVITHLLQKDMITERMLTAFYLTQKKTILLCAIH